MKPICVIPARGGSKGVPRKNIRPLLNKPLIAYTIEKSLKSDIFSHVIVSTEDKEIAKISKKFGAEVPFMRPKNLAKDTTGMAEVLVHAVLQLNSLGYDFDVFVNRDCTVPFIRDSDIASSIKLLKKSNCDAVYGVYRQHLNPYFNMMELNSKGFLNISKKLAKRPRSRHEAPVVYQLNGLFTYNKEKFLKTGNSIMSKAIPFEIPLERVFMIDTEAEFNMAKLMFKKMISK